MNEENIGKPAICYETGFDEAFLVGTEEELSHFAHSILRLLGEQQKTMHYHGVITRQPLKNSQLSEPMSEIALESIVIVDSKKDRRELINKIRINGGMAPIDWDGHDEWKSRSLGL